MHNDPHYLRSVYTLFKKELMAYFNSPIAYIYIGVFLIVGNWIFFKAFFLSGELSMRGYFTLLPWIFLFMAPAVTMRLWSEEKKSGTIEFLLTLPVTNWQLVLAKFFSAFTFLALNLALTLTIPYTMSQLGQPDFGPIVGSYLGALGLGAAYLSLGMFMSSLTKNQIVALIMGITACFVAFIIGQDFIIAGAPPYLATFLTHLSISWHFENIARGLIDTKDIFYYLSFTFFWLWLNVKVLQGRKWQ